MNGLNAAQTERESDAFKRRAQLGTTEDSEPGLTALGGQLVERILMLESTVERLESQRDRLLINQEPPSTQAGAVALDQPNPPPIVQAQLNLALERLDRLHGRMERLLGRFERGL